MTSLPNRVALITGAARGIGRATAYKLGREGAQLVLGDVDGDLLEGLTHELRESGISAHAVPGDITKDGYAANFVGAAIERFGNADIVINNAGYIWPQAIHKMADEQFDAMLDVHLTAPFRILRALGPFLKDADRREQKNGESRSRKVVNISSIVATSGSALSVNYAAGKAAIIGLTRALAQEWEAYRVNVNCIVFGMIATRYNDPDFAKDPIIRVGTREINIGTMGANAEANIKLIPLGRAGSVEDAANGIYLFCIPESNGVTGQTLAVDGGLG